MCTISVGTLSKDDWGVQNKVSKINERLNMTLLLPIALVVQKRDPHSFFFITTSLNSISSPKNTTWMSQQVSKWLVSGL